MIKLKISYFKCFVNADIILNRFTVLAGANGYGKSTTIQALLFLRKTIETYAKFEKKKGYYNLDPAYSDAQNIPLNSDYLLMLGNSSLVLNKQSDKDIFISLVRDSDSLSATYEADNRTPQLWLTSRKINSSLGAYFPIMKNEFYYLNAERLGPRVIQDIQYLNYLNVGWQGENTSQVISTDSGYYKINTNRLFPETQNPNIEFQVNQWLNYIIPGVKVKANTNSNSLSSQILIENAYTLGDPSLSTNIGFGISYVLPIIVTGLIATENSCFIVENPEAHLHPYAQSKIAQFLAHISNAGVNVLVETHSDHIINGLQIAVAKKAIENEFVTFNYFSHREGLNQPYVNQISISENGELSEWPRGFFDQTQKDFAKLIKLRNNV